MNHFIYHIPTKIYFGENQLHNLGKEVSKFGKRVLLTYGGGSIKKSGLYDQVQAELKGAGLKIFELSGIEPNPRVSSVREGVKICKENEIDVLLAVGGGSVIDCTKFIGAGAYYDGDPWEISLGNVKVEQCLPIISVLTLSATGSEMDAGGVISNPETNQKLGFAAPPMRPKVSFLDPSITYSVNAFQTASGAADILSHLFEVYFNLDADLYMLDAMMEAMMKTVIRFAPVAVNDPKNYEARANLMWASSWAINGFINGGKAKAWSCHPMEHELSAFYDITHGLGLAILTPRWMRYTLNDQTEDRFYQFGCNVFGIDPKLSKRDVALKSIEMLEEFLFDTLGLARTLTEIGIDDTHFERMAQKACRGSQIQGFQTLNPTDVVSIYEMCR